MKTFPHVELVYNRRHIATASKEAGVDLRIGHLNRQKYMSTGIRLLPKHWHNGQVVGRVDANILNKTLDKLMVDVRTIIYEMVEEGNIDIFAIPERLKRLRNGNISFLDFCEKRAEIRRYGKSVDSKERYDRFLKFLIKWGYIKDWADITEQKIIELDKYLTSTGMKPYSKWNNYHRFLNSFILDAINEGIISRNPYRWVHIEKDKNSKGLDKCLTPEEFQCFVDWVPATNSLEKVRDLFCFQVYTCMAYTDLTQFNAKKIEVVKGTKVYMCQRLKTNVTFTVPLLQPALDILKKYKNRLPLLSNVKYNQYIKVIAQACGIDKPLTTHWARHTGATLLLNSGVSMQIVSKVLGHANTRITEQIYAKVLNETVVDAVNDVSEKITKIKGDGTEKV